MAFPTVTNRIWIEPRCTPACTVEMMYSVAELAWIVVHEDAAGERQVNTFMSNDADDRAACEAWMRGLPHKPLLPDPA